MSKKILVACGTRFIGSQLYVQLLDGGNEVLCADNLFTGSKYKTETLLSNEKLKFIEHDVTEPLDINLATRKLGWQPKVKLNKGLVETINYFRRQTNV